MMSSTTTPKNETESLLLKLQIELVKMQKQVIAKGDQVLIIFEGRDAAGKDGAIKAFIENLSPRDTKVVALDKPSKLEEGDWYFKRYVSELPRKGQIVIFNRSWYNRAGVELVMKFCTKLEYETFMKNVNSFEDMLVDSGIKFFKYYLDISKKEQARRFKSRENNPLKQWKISPIDSVAQKKWVAYSKARDAMLLRTNHREAPWTVIDANDKKLAHLNIFKDLLGRYDYPQKDKRLLINDQNLVKVWAEDALKLPNLEP
jgi:polyphosphate kinase 2